MTWYDVLEVSRHATSDEIKRAYRRLALIRHPDAGGSTQTMQTLLEAYRILSNVRLRRAYNATLDTEEIAVPFANTSDVRLDHDIIPAHLLLTESPIFHSNQHILLRSNRQLTSAPRCVIGIHSVIAIPSEECLVVLAVIRNVSAQIQPLRATGTILLDQVGLQSSGDSAWGDLWRREIAALWPSDVEVSPGAMARLSMYYPWDGFAHPARWIARWSIFEPGYTSGQVKGYIDLVVSLSELTQ